MGTEHQWLGDEKIIDFDNKHYYGIVVYYGPLTTAGGSGNLPQTLPGDNPPGDPPPKVRQPILSALLRVWSGIVAFVKRLFFRR